jgi:butyrate kinase
MKTRILAINPGSTSTKAVLFEDGLPSRAVEITHPADELARHARVMGQLGLRMAAVRAGLGDPGPLDAVVGRGGFLAPIPGGVYAVGEAMLGDLRQARYGEHASNLGAFMALEFASEDDARRAVSADAAPSAAGPDAGTAGHAPRGCPAVVVDPVVTDELMDEARLTGLPELRRRSVFHALGQRGAAREAARRLGIDYGRGRFIVAHMGGGITVGAHRQGRVLDVTNGIDGEGPFTPERSGALPIVPLLDMIERGEKTPAELRRAVTRGSGLLAHLGTSDLREVEARIAGGDEKARLVFDAMAYAVAKAIASMAPALEGRVEAVVLTGGMARSTRLIHALTRFTAFLGPVVVVTGVEEMAAMEMGARLALEGKLPVQGYPPEAV